LPKNAFYDNHELTLSKQGQKPSYGRELFCRIYDAAYSHEKGCTIYAVDQQGDIHGALFVIRDETSAYDLISTIDPEYRNSGSASLLVREIIRHMAQWVNKFDFEGSMIEPVENSFRQFGGKQRAYFQVYFDNRSVIEKSVLRCRNQLRRLRR